MFNANLKKKYRKNGFYPYIFRLPILSFYLRVEHRAFSIKKKKRVFYSQVGRSIEPIYDDRNKKGKRDQTGKQRGKNTDFRMTIKSTYGMKRGEQKKNELMSFMKWQNVILISTTIQLQSFLILVKMLQSKQKNSSTNIERIHVHIRKIIK